MSSPESSAAIVTQPQSAAPSTSPSAPSTSPYALSTSTSAPAPVERSDSDKSSECKPLSSDYNPSSESTSSSDDEESARGEDSRYIVFGEKLAELHNFYKQCGSPVVHKKEIKRGSMIGFKIACHQGHEYTWHSQPYQNDMPLGNLLIAAALLITGCTFAKISAFAAALNLQLFSKTVFNWIQRTNLLPVIQETWENERRKAVAAVKRLGSVVLGGDARCDTPGHNAKFGSYTLMHSDGDDGHQGTRKIVSMKLVQVSEVIYYH